MSIIRTEHNKSNPYVIVKKSILERDDVSWEAKGYYCYLLTLNDDDLFKSEIDDYPRLTNELVSFGLLEVSHD